MHGDFFLIETPEGEACKAARLPLGDTAGRNEAWLRDTLFEHPDILPISDLEPAFGPLIPLCRELRTEAGPLDICFINGDGRLTLVECKLWRNAEARRKVVAQVLDYARAITRWTYSDLQRQVSAATGRKGNVPFEAVRARFPHLAEHHFADAVTRAMRSGRFLLIIAGDGIREDVGAMAELINRNAAAAFSVGLVEVALYGFGEESLAIQPRVIARTHLIERTVVVLNNSPSFSLTEDPAVTEDRSDVGGIRDEQPQGTVDQTKVAEQRQWWAPVIAAPLDDPEQEPPKVYWPNNVRLPLPWPKTWITGYRTGNGTKERLGVILVGGGDSLSEFWRNAKVTESDLREALPAGTTILDDGGQLKVKREVPGSEFASEDAKRDWLIATINSFVNVLRPAMR